MKDEEIKKIDAWLEGLSKESINKISMVSNVLQSISELTGTTLFDVPYEAFEKANLDKTSIIAILTELWRKEVLDFMTPSGENCVSGWSKEYVEDNSFYDDTMLTIRVPLFNYLLLALSQSQSKVVVFPPGRDFVYENNELHIRLQDGSACTLDLSRANALRPVFETFFNLYKNGAKTLFDRKELLQTYKELTGEDTIWDTFIDRKSSICGKMIYKKECLRNRIIWKYEKSLDKFRFEILPLSDN